MFFFTLQMTKKENQKTVGPISEKDAVLKHKASQVLKPSDCGIISSHSSCIRSG